MSKDWYKIYIVDEMLGHIPGITAKAMFGGYGLYKDGKIFGMIADGQVYFKVGSDNQPDYEAHGSKPFTYPGPGGKPYAMSYWEVPESILEDKRMVAAWLEASLRAVEKNKRK